MKYIDGLLQDCDKPSALAKELLQSCAKPYIIQPTKYEHRFIMMCVVIMVALPIP